MSCIRQTSMVLVLFTVTTLVWASAADELSEPNEVVPAEAAAAAGDAQEDIVGRDVSAEGIQEESERRERGDRDRRSPLQRQQNRIRELEQQLKQQLERLRRAEDAIETDAHLPGVRGQFKDELAARRRRFHREQPEGRAGRPGHDARRAAVEEHRPHPEIAERIEHMQAAVRHLVEAGLPHIAEQVEQQIIAARRESEARHHRGHDGADKPDVVRQMMRQLDELRHEVGQLRETVDALREDR